MDIQSVVANLRQVEHDFKHIMLAGDQFYADAGLDHYAVALGLLTDQSYQGRMLGTYILGLLAPALPLALVSLREVVVLDAHWRIQEMLAKAFDYYCMRIGYHEA